MSTDYRVIDLRGAEGREHRVASGKAPERAASEALGLDLVRSGSPRELTAKVYWRNVADEPINVVRLYVRVEGSRPRRAKKEHF